MTIKRYTATLDNTITNAFKDNLTTRGTDANMGASDILEVFSIYGQVPSQKASTTLYISPSHSIPDDDSQQIILAGDSTYTFVASSTDAPNKFNVSGKTSAGVLIALTDIINTSASVDFTATIDGGNLKIRAANPGTEGNNFTISSSLDSITPNTETNLAGGTDASEAARALMQFDTDAIQADRAADEIPAVGSVSFYLRVHNAPHGQTLPKDYNLTVLALSRSWEEGYGLDMESYRDEDTSNWVNASTNVTWSTQGGDFHSAPEYTQAISDGTEDIELDITELVEQWLTGSKDNHGVAVKLSASHESDVRSFYTKRFFARGSEFHYLKPKIEARWQTGIQDDRSNFYASSSLVPAADNLNTLYIYNRVRGELKDIPTDATNLTMSLYYGESSGPAGTVLETATVSKVSTGIYSSTVAINTTSSYLYDVWHSDSTQYVTGSRVSVRTFAAESSANTGEHVSNIVNLKEKYSQSESARMRMFVRDKDWNPTIYTVATTNIETKIINEAYYKVHRIADGFDVIPYGTGSVEFTKMSYDKDGNYFDLDISLFEKDYSYGIKVAYKNSGRLEEQPELFKFRVE